MKCKECGEREVIKVRKQEHVVFQCKKGHKWFEDYVENVGPHKRPKSYELKLEDILFPSEKKLYKKILGEIEKDPDFFARSTPEEITTFLIETCQFNREDIYTLFKKVSLFK